MYQNKKDWNNKEKQKKKKDKERRFCVDGEVNIYSGCIVAVVMWDM